MEIRKVKIQRKIKLVENHYWMEISNNFSSNIFPGQFLNIKIDDLFLRRPFSIAEVDKKHIGILFKVKGEGTKILSETKSGEILDVVGPLGNCFPFQTKWQNFYLIGGGTGIAPLLFFCKMLIEKNIKFTLFYGARTKKLLFTNLLPKGNYYTIFSTDDGSYGYKGDIINILRMKLEERGNPDIICAGGPISMLKELSRISTEYKIPSYVSVENKMACGMGLCFGCVIKIKNKNKWEYKRVCKEGPIFQIDKIIWE